MNFTKSIFALFITAIAIASCESDEQTAQPTENVELSAGAQDFLAMKAAITSINSSAGRTDSFKKITQSAGRMRSDTVGGDSTNVTCGEFTTKYNQDGSVTTTSDYGDGCHSGDQFIFGRQEVTWKYWLTYNGPFTRSNFYYAAKYKNYGGTYDADGQEVSWLQDGTLTDQGYSEYDSTNGAYQGVFEHQAHLTSGWNGDTFEHRGSSTTRYNSTEAVVEQSDFTYSVNGDGFYRVKVLEPLVMKYSCTSTDSLGILGTYVSGVESVHYKNSGGEGSFEVDYGDGECDMIITIIEKGKRKKVNLSEVDLIARKD